MSTDDALVICSTCGMPVRVTFDDDGEVQRVLTVCGHIDASAPAQEQVKAPDERSTDDTT